MRLEQNAGQDFLGRSLRRGGWPHWCGCGFWGQLVPLVLREDSSILLFALSFQQSFCHQPCSVPVPCQGRQVPAWLWGCVWLCPASSADGSPGTPHRWGRGHGAGTQPFAAALSVHTACERVELGQSMAQNSAGATFPLSPLACWSPWDAGGPRCLPVQMEYSLFFPFYRPLH